MPVRRPDATARPVTDVVALSSERALIWMATTRMLTGWLRQAAERCQGSAGEDELSERVAIGGVLTIGVDGWCCQRPDDEGNNDRCSDNQASHGFSLPPPVGRPVAGGSSGGLGSQYEAR
jgi:hypothetical protein